MKPTKDQARTILTILSYGPRSRTGISVRMSARHNTGLAGALQWLRIAGAVYNKDQAWSIENRVLRKGIDSWCESHCRLI